MKRIIILLLVHVSIVQAQHPQHIIDSLERELNVQVADSSKADLYLSLSAESLSYHFDKAKPYADSALYYSLKANKFRLPEIYNNLGLIENELGNHEKARSYYDKALTILDENDNKAVRGIIYGNYSASYDNSNNFDKELAYSLKAIELNKGDDYELSFLYYNHSVIYEDAGFHREAIDYLKLSRNMAERSGEIRVEAYATMNLAYDAMDEKMDYDEAGEYLIRVGEICDETNSLEICHYYYMTLGRLETLQGEYDKAEESLQKSIEIAEERKLDSKLKESYLMLANLEFERGNYAKAQEIFNTKNVDSFEVIGLWYANLMYRKRANLESKLGNFKRSNELLNAYITYADSIHKSENRLLLTNADRRYKVEKKNKEIATQQLALNQQQAEIQKKKTQTNYMTGIIVFLVLLSILIYFTFKQRQKRKSQELIRLKKEIQVKSLESLIEGEEKERMRVAQELHDSVNADLASVKYKLNSMLEQNMKVVEEAVKMIDKSCEQVRAISHNLVPPSLKDFSLLEALNDYCSTKNSLTAIDITFNVMGQPLDLNEKQQLNVYRIIQELVNNALKHAEANSILVQLSFSGDILHITVEDDGKGFDVDSNYSGIGLKNVKSRVDYLEGTIDVSSDKNGSTFEIEIKTI